MRVRPWDWRRSRGSFDKQRDWREIIVDPHGRDGADAGLSLGIDGGEHGEFRLANDGVSELVEAVGIDGFGTGFHGEKRSGRVA
jgi:hypothetical protein